MYNKWLKTCSEKELFVFYESQYVGLLDGLYRSKETRDRISSMLTLAKKESRRFSTDFREWYQKWRWWCMNDISREQWLEWLRKMPWNLEND